MQRVLIYDPDPQLCVALRGELERRGHVAVAEACPEAAQTTLRRQRFAVVLWYVGEGGVGALFELKRHFPDTVLVATSGLGNPELVVSCMRAGASDFWLRSPDLEGFASMFEEILRRVVRDAPSGEALDFPFPKFIGRHPKILEILQLILTLRGSDSTVLITGESGTGKEVIARAIHDLSSRREYALVTINCAAIPSSLLESELFGHVRGAFTGATRDRIGRFRFVGKGTLFLDEIGEIPFEVQAKLLRAIQHKFFEPVGSAQSLRLEARIIAATNQDLEAAVAEKRFREDLYYRLNVIPIYIPPLRSRKSDIPLLARTFLEHFFKANGKVFVGISEDAMRRLMEYHWPGNVRELENMMERVAVLKQGDGIVEWKDLPLTQFQRVRPDRRLPEVELPEEGVDLNEVVSHLENELIRQALQRTGGNKNRAASLLHLNRTTFVEKLKRRGLRLS